MGSPREEAPHRHARGLDTANALRDVRKLIPRSGHAVVVPQQPAQPVPASDMVPPTAVAAGVINSFPSP
jgi:hypothetical protein